MFVESNTRTAAFIRQNITAVGKSLGRDASELQVVNADATTVSWGAAPDLVFIDPPYDIILTIAPKLFTRLADLLPLKPDLIVVFEMPGEMELTPAGWTCLKRLGKGVRQPTACVFNAS